MGMKSLYSWTILLTANILMFSCKRSIVQPHAFNNSLIQTAQDLFLKGENDPKVLIAPNGESSNYQSLRVKSAREPIWSRASIVQFEGAPAVIVPVKYSNPFYVHSSFGGSKLYSIDDLTKLLIYSDSRGQYHIDWLSCFPDSLYKFDNAFSGIVFVDKWSGDPVIKYLYEVGGKVFLDTSKGVQPISQDAREGNAIINNSLEIIETCYEIDGYNYSQADPGAVYYWSEPAGCNYIILNDAGGTSSTGGAYGGAAGEGGIGAAALVEVSSGTNVIGNIIDYNKCFTNVAGSGNIFKVTVCVDQPEPGTRQAWGISSPGVNGSTFGSNPVNVGHCFLIFSESTGAGQIKRNVGFYPSTGVSPVSPVAPGEFSNDDQHGYNIALTIAITNSQFFTMLNFVNDEANAEYNLNSFNCVSFVIQTLAKGDLYLPSTIGTWPGGSGNDPGDLGEDIRSMPLLSNMTLSTTSSSHPNLGTCY
jgi:hypothetical protein